LRPKSAIISLPCPALPCPALPCHVPVILALKASFGCNVHRQVRLLQSLTQVRRGQAGQAGQASQAGTKEGGDYIRVGIFAQRNYQFRCLICTSSPRKILLASRVRGLVTRDVSKQSQLLSHYTPAVTSIYLPSERSTYAQTAAPLSRLLVEEDEPTREREREALLVRPLCDAASVSRQCFPEDRQTSSPDSGMPRSASPHPARLYTGASPQLRTCHSNSRHREPARYLFGWQRLSQFTTQWSLIDHGSTICAIFVNVHGSLNLDAVN
jgi:hypothetical protein